MRWNGARPTRKAVGAAVVVGILLVAWWWPGLTGQDQQTDVLIVSTPTFTESRNVIDRRLREEGLTTDWSPSMVALCTFDSSEDLTFEVLVFELAASRDCDADMLEAAVNDLRSMWRSRPMVAVLDWAGATPADSLVRTLRTSNVTLVDPRSLIGSDGEVQNCLWWDDCPEDGRIMTVVDGGLTEAGMQRLARSIVTGVLQ